jgi:hypothetical protein
MQIVSPVDPCVAAAAYVQLVLEAVLFQQLGKVLRAVQGEVLVLVASPRLTGLDGSPAD